MDISRVRIIGIIRTLQREKDRSEKLTLCLKSDCDKSYLPHDLYGHQYISGSSKIVFLKWQRTYDHYHMS